MPYAPMELCKINAHTALPMADVYLQNPGWLLCPVSKKFKMNQNVQKNMMPIMSAKATICVNRKFIF